MLERTSLQIAVLSCMLVVSGAAGGDKPRSEKQARNEQNTGPRVVSKEVALGPAPAGAARESVKASPDNPRVAYLEIAKNKAVVVVDGVSSKPHDDVGDVG